MSAEAVCSVLAPTLVNPCTTTAKEPVNPTNAASAPVTIAGNDMSFSDAPTLF